MIKLALLAGLTGSLIASAVYPARTDFESLKGDFNS